MNFGIQKRLVMFLAIFLLAVPVIVNASLIFYEGFEGVGYENQDWTIVGAGDWKPDDKEEYAGADALSVNNIGGIAWDEISINTQGYENITLSFYYKTQGAFETAEYIAADYWNGTEWVNVLNVSNIVSYAFDNNSLSEDANDNSEFKIRFACSNNAPSEYCLWDEVKVEGDGEYKEMMMFWIDPDQDELASEQPQIIEINSEDQELSFLDSIFGGFWSIFS